MDSVKLVFSELMDTIWIVLNFVSSELMDTTWMVLNLFLQN